MSLLRFASLLVLALWIGGLAVLGGVVAPAVFAVIQQHDPQSGRVLAGAVFGEAFAAFLRMTWGLGALLLALFAARAALGPRPRGLRWRAWAAAGMLGASLVSGLVLAPRIDALRREVSGPIASLAASDPRKVAFGRLHGISDVLMILTLVAGTGLLWAEARDR